MADFDIHTRSPDRGHEGILVAVRQAIEDIQLTVDDLGISFDLADTLFVLLGDALTAVEQAQAERGVMADRLTSLEERVTALEPTPAGAAEPATSPVS